MTRVRGAEPSLDVILYTGIGAYSIAMCQTSQQASASDAGTWALGCTAAASLRRLHLTRLAICTLHPPIFQKRPPRDLQPRRLVRAHPDFPRNASPLLLARTLPVTLPDLHLRRPSSRPIHLHPSHTLHHSLAHLRRLLRPRASPHPPARG